MHKKFNTYLGNYSYYRQKRAELERLAREKQEEEAQRSKSQAKQGKAAVPEKPKINKSKVRKEIEQLEEQIQAGELRAAELSELLADGATYQDEEKSRLFVAEYKQLEESIPAWYEAWEQLQLLLE